MPQLIQAGNSGALDHIDVTQAQLREQLATAVDLFKQVTGNANVVAGSAAPSDPLTAPFTLYVNPFTGDDRFIGGSFNEYEAAAGATDAEKLDAKVKRLEQQRMVCGYSPQRPFKTINRAVIEAAIITSKNFYSSFDTKSVLDTVSIVLSPGVHTVHNDPGSSSTSLASWGTDKSPSIAELIAFNPTSGGVLLPRGCSLCGPDLRKTTLRPTYVPAVADEAADYSNRAAILKVTGTGYFFGFTAMDKEDYTQSHHLLDAFQFGSQADLDAFYAKCLSSVGTGADLSAALTVTELKEYQIVGPIDSTQSPTEAWDTTGSASPYIFNVSVRSMYGLGGAFMDGNRVTGLKSMVCANFTGVSLQKDMRCWEKYVSPNWVSISTSTASAGYTDYINGDPDNIRMDPNRRSRHISAVNNAVIQEVSVFAIGQGVHHFTDTGGEISITNSNSNFGGCAAISKGYKTYAFPSDLNWTVDSLKVPLNLSEKTGNIRYIYLGTIASATASAITLNTGLATTSESSTVPQILYSSDYSLAASTYIWVENPTGDPWYATLDAAAWSSSATNTINIGGAISGTASTTDPNGNNLLLGKRVYIRRVVDTRTSEERRVSLYLNNTATARLPQRNFILQTDPGRTGGSISSLLDPEDEILIISNTGTGLATGGGVASTAEVTVRRGAYSNTYTNSTYYNVGTVVKYNNKHYQASRSVTTSSAAPDPSIWNEIYVHMPSAFNVEDRIDAEGQLITIDSDTDTNPNSTTLGINWTTIWTTAGAAQNAYRASTDYQGTYEFLRALGFSNAAAHNALVPQTAGNRVLDPADAADFPSAPSGGAATGLGNWAVEFRRPSMLRLFAHAWEWAGYLNYSKAFPAAQKDLSAQNKFTYYFTNELGGRVVPQGSNEDGFNVSPRGLEDVETGATLSVEGIGSSSVDDFQTTSFENLSVTNTLTVASLNVTGTIQGLPDVNNASTTITGPVQLAGAAVLRGTATPSGTDAEIDAAINANAAPQVVTLKGLNYWRSVQAPDNPIFGMLFS